MFSFAEGPRYEGTSVATTSQLNFPFTIFRVFPMYCYEIVPPLTCEPVSCWSDCWVVFLQTMWANASPIAAASLGFATLLPLSASKWAANTTAPQRLPTQHTWNRLCASHSYSSSGNAQNHKAPSFFWRILLYRGSHSQTAAIREGNSWVGRADCHTGLHHWLIPEKKREKNALVRWTLFV